MSSPETSSPETSPPEAAPPKAAPPKASPPKASPPKASPPKASPPEGSSPDASPPKGSSPDTLPPKGSSPEALPPKALTSLSNIITQGKDKLYSLKNTTSETLGHKYDETKKYLTKHIEDPNSKLGKFLTPIINHKQEFKVGAAVLTGVAFSGMAYKKYQNMKMTKLQKEKIEVLKKEKMAALKAELEKSKLSAARKKKIMTLFLLGSVGAIILGSKVKSLKKGGSNKKLTLKK